MPNRLELRGFTELQRELAVLPRRLDAAADPVLLRYARRAAEQVRAAYPVVTGNLRAGVEILARTARGVATLYTLVSSSPHAHLYEFGTARTAPRATFLPITETERHDAVRAVADLVRAEGLTVAGDRT